MLKKFPHVIISLLLSIIFLTSCANNRGSNTNKYDLRGNKANDNLSKYEDNSHISITGKVISSEDNTFELKYKTNKILVKMENWDSEEESKFIKKGEWVTVYGYLDRDYFQKDKIVAYGIYAHNRDEYYFSDDKDREDKGFVYLFINKFDQSKRDETNLSLKGKVTDIESEDKKFILETNSNSFKQVRIDTSKLGYNPLDNEGHLKIKEGDQVYVSGKLDVNFFDKNEIEANKILKLHKFGK